MSLFRKKKTPQIAFCACQKTLKAVFASGTKVSVDLNLYTMYWTIGLLFRPDGEAISYTISYTCSSKQHSSGKFPEANWLMINWPQLWAREKALGFNSPRVFKCLI